MEQTLALIKNNKITKINLTFPPNRHQDIDIIVLTDALEHNHLVTNLNLKYMNMDDLSIQIFSNLLKHNKSYT